MLAPIVPFWLPPEISLEIISSAPLFEPLLSTAFIAILMKGVNDILWWTIILTYLRRTIPKSETSKILSILFILLMLVGAFTPIPSGFIYTYYGAMPLLLISLIANVIILTILGSKTLDKL